MKNLILLSLLSLTSVFASSLEYGDSFVQNGFKIKFLFCDQKLKCHTSTRSGNLNRECQQLGLRSAFIVENSKVCPERDLGTVCGCVEEYIGEE